MNAKHPYRLVGCLLITFLVLQFHTPISYVQAQEETPLSLETLLRFSHLSTDDGLIQNTVTAIVQDDYGFMWFGTESGLSRYDGYRFTTFQHDPENPNSLSHNFVRDLYAGDDGMIWIATEGGGINRLDPNTLEFTRYFEIAEQETPGDRHHIIFQDSRGHIWAGKPPNAGLVELDPVAETVTIYSHDEIDPGGLGSQHFGEIIETNDRMLWMAAGNAVIRCDLNAQSFTSYALHDFGENDLKAILEDSKGQIWAGGELGLYKLNVDTGSFDLYPEPVYINNILEIEDNMLWLATETGLYRFDVQNEQVVGHDEPYPAISDSLNNSTIDTLYQDRSGKIWLAGDSGLDIYDPHMARFDYYRHLAPGAPGNLVAGDIQAIHISDQDIAWIGIDSTLQKVNLNTNAITVYPLEDYGQAVYHITAIYQDHAGILWVGCNEYHLLRFDPATETLIEYHSFPKPDQAPEDASIIGLHEDRQNNLWVVLGYGGVYRLDEAREEIVRYAPPTMEPSPNRPLPQGVLRIEQTIRGSYIDREENFWFTTIDGLFRFDPVTETYQYFRLLTANDMPADAWTEACLEDPDGIIWVAARDGLFRLDPETEEVKAYTTEDGLPTNYLVGILQDESGDLWISTQKGLSRFTPATETFRNYDVFDGLQGNEFYPRVFAQTGDGRMFFGGSNGLTAFYPDEIVDSSYEPQVVLVDLKLFNQSVQPGEDSPLVQPIWMTNSLTLNHDQNIITFEFVVLNYAFGDTNQYRYRLDGLETEWNEVDSHQHFATYTNLQAGDYVFRVQAANRDGIWSKEEVSLSLTILPPWWETTWFRVLAVLTGVSLVVAGVQWRVYALRKQSRVLEAQVAERTRELAVALDKAEVANRAKDTFLANMSHELRSPLNAILGYAQIISRQQAISPDTHENLRVIMRSGEHLLALINQVLDLSKVEAGHMTLNETGFDLYRLLSDLEEMFILRANKKQLQLLFERADDVPQYVFADVTKLRQTLINLISNGLKFTTTGKVAVRVNKVDTEFNSSLLKLQFEVEDTGIGISTDEIAHLFEAFVQTSAGYQTQEGTGLGLAISQRFVRLMGGEISVKSEVGKGTTFTFDIACRVASETEMKAAYQHQQIVGLASDQPQYRIMVVDDNKPNRQFIRKLLEPIGFQVREAENGEQAIEVAQDFKPHLIWMDIRMPGMDGIEASRRLKAMPEGQAVKIIALTASGDEEDREKMNVVGSDDFARKPVKVDTVFELLSEHIGVKYVYEDAAQSRNISEQSLLSSEELATALDSIPEELLIRLRAGVEVSDITVIDEAIAEIQAYHAGLAETLHRLAQRFQFDELLALLGGGEKA